MWNADAGTYGDDYTESAANSYGDAGAYQDAEALMGRIPNVPIEVFFAAKFLFYFFLLVCSLYILIGPTPSDMPVLP